MRKGILFTKVAIDTVVKPKNKTGEKKENYVSLIEYLFEKLIEAGDSATFEVSNVNSFKTAYYRLRRHRNYSVSMKNKYFLIRDSDSKKPIRTGESRPAKIDFILIEDKNAELRPKYTQIPLTEQYPNMTIEQIQAMLNREED